ncbi:MAG: hypothetical protein ACK5JN_13705 [Kluyvera sp.]|uniref:hypothetical protein n=1 Tax=Kluyvera sp. TaxID=1538228 RepID=UPI003A8B7102
MVIVIVCYIAGGILTFILVAALRGSGIMDKETDSISALVAAVAWPFTLMALIGCITLWWLFDVLELLFFATSTYFRSRK